LVKIMESKKQKLKRLRLAFSSQCLCRDHDRCVMCGRSGVKLSAHHITDRHLMPNDGYALSNGISLCDEGSSFHVDSCHMKAEQFHITGGRDHVPGFHPNELYIKIGSSFERAKHDSEELK
jgi:hypothetical protein